MTRSQLLAAILALTFSIGILACPDVAHAKKQETKKVVKSAKKDNGKIKPLDPDRKVPTLKKKYKKD